MAHYTKLSSGGNLTEMSKYDSGVSKFTHTVKIQHTDAFSLRPVTLTEGPLAGRNVLVLEPISIFFRFLDLPAKIRQIIYDLLLRDADYISITTRKPLGTPRRAQRKIIDVVRTGKPKVGLLSTNVLDTFLRISKQVASEAATTFYGNNVFEFDNIGNMQVFLTGIGSMRKHLRYLRVAEGGYTLSKARPTFTLLKDATSLRTLALDHNILCQRKKEVAADLKTLFKHLYKIQEQQKQDGKTGESDVLGIIKTGWSSDKCTHCSASPKKNGCPRFLDCEFDCDDGVAHSEEVLAEAKAMVAKSIGAAD